MNIRDAIIAEARTWFKTPYHPCARVKGVGVDCVTLLCEVYEAVGLIPHVELGNYPPEWHLHRSEQLYLEGIRQYAREVQTPLKGDIALFQFGRCVSHGAIVVDWPLVIDAHARRVVSLNNGEQGDLKGRVRNYFTLVKEGA